MVRASDLEIEPLSIDPEPAWHEYAVEYGLRVRGRDDERAPWNGRHSEQPHGETGAARCAHAAVSRRYARFLPVRTTCGVITEGQSPGKKPILASQRWRYRWLRESLEARRAQRGYRQARRLLSDIRLDIDDTLAEDEPPLTVVDCRSSGEGWGDVVLRRRGLPVALRSLAFADGLDLVRARHRGRGSVLVTGCSASDLEAFRAELDHDDVAIGYSTDIGHWALTGPAAARGAPQWAARRAQPARMSPF